MFVSGAERERHYTNMTLPIDAIQDGIIADFGIFDQWMEKYEYIIDLGKNMQPLDERYKREENLVPGCQSRVWLHAELVDRKVIFTADSDAIITKGIIALLLQTVSGQPPEAIGEAELYFIDRIGLREHLSPNRSNGLVNMIRKIKSVASGFSAAG